MCIHLYALMCRSIWVKSGEEWVKSCCELFTPANLPVYRYFQGKVKSEEYFRVCFHIIFIGQDYDMTTLLYQG